MGNIYIFLFTMLAAAAVYDIAGGSIPNRYIVWSMVNVFFFKIMYAEGDNGGNPYMLVVTQMADCIKGAAVAFVCVFMLYVTGAVGAGDAKLYMVMGMLVDKTVLMKMGVAALCMAVAYGIVMCVYASVKNLYVKDTCGRADQYNVLLLHNKVCLHMHRIALAPWMFAGALLIYTDMVVKGGI